MINLGAWNQAQKNGKNFFSWWKHNKYNFSNISTHSLKDANVKIETRTNFLGSSMHEQLYRRETN